MYVDGGGSAMCMHARERDLVTVDAEIIHVS
jgi:hypothetical protein